MFGAPWRRPRHRRQFLSAPSLFFTLLHDFALNFSVRNSGRHLSPSILFVSGLKKSISVISQVLSGVTPLPHLFPRWKAVASYRYLILLFSCRSSYDGTLLCLNNIACLCPHFGSLAGSLTLLLYEIIVTIVYVSRRNYNRTNFGEIAVYLDHYLDFSTWSSFKTNRKTYKNSSKYFALYAPHAEVPSPLKSVPLKALMLFRTTLVLYIPVRETVCVYVHVEEEIFV